MIRLAVFIVTLALTLRVGMADTPATGPASRSADNGAIAVNPDLPDYQRVPELSGTISSVGSPATGALISACADEFKKIYPNVEFDLKGGNSAAVLPAFLSKTPPNLGSMSRPMTEDEIAAFKKRFGYAPTAIRVAVNAVAIFVNPDNPCPGLSLTQLRAIYSRPGPLEPDQILTWGATGLRDDAWATERILPYILNSTVGASGLLKSRVMPNSDFRYDAQTELTSSAVVEDCAVDRGAIGYTSIIFRTPRTHTLPVAGADGRYYQPTYDNCVSQRYPLADFLYIYVNKAPDRGLDAPTREFLTFACCQVGQEIAAREGGFPLTPQLAREQLDAIGK
jgi:phosphate transport system substrate-binding protein